MTKEQFAAELRNKLPKYMPDRCKNLRFCIKKINKNNGVELTGILIDDGSRCTPAIYIDEMYDSFCNNPDFEEIIRNLAKTIVDVMDSKPDTDNILIVGLNGEVSRAEGQHITPGDRILVMPRFDSKNLQLVKDVTQVLYQMAVAVKVAVGL